MPNDSSRQRPDSGRIGSNDEDAGQAAWSHIFSPRLLLNVRAAGTRLSGESGRTQRHPGGCVPAARVPPRLCQLRASAPRPDAHEIKVGGDLLYAPVREALQYHITDRSFFDPATPIDFAFADRRTDREQSLFAQDTFRAGNLTASAGLRWDRYRFVVDDSAFSPRLGVAWYWPAADLVLRASYDRAFQTPAMENLLLASSRPGRFGEPEVLRLPVPPSRGNYIRSRRQHGNRAGGAARRHRVSADLPQLRR